MVLLAAGVVAGVWLLVWDMFLSGPLLGSMLTAIPGLNPDPAVPWMIVGNLAGGLVLALLYGRVRGAFGTGAASGAQFGFFAGLLVNFPLWLQLSLYVSWPYGTAWAFTIAGLVVYVIAGALVGLVYQRMAKGAAATA